jgi:hypothetical protein
VLVGGLLAALLKQVLDALVDVGHPFLTMIHTYIQYT